MLYNMIPRTASRSLLASVRPSTRTSIISRASAIRSSASQFTRSFQSSPTIRKGIHPESANPPAPNPQSAPVAGAAFHVTEPSPLTPEEYYEYSEHYFNVLLAHLETAQEEGSDVEAEYSVCSVSFSRGIRMTPLLSQRREPSTITAQSKVFS